MVVVVVAVVPAVWEAQVVPVACHMSVGGGSLLTVWQREVVLSSD